MSVIGSLRRSLGIIANQRVGDGVMRSPWYLTLAAAGLVAGCAALTSEIDNNGEGRVDGVAYNLPRSLLTVAVWQYHDPSTSRTWYTVGGATISGGTATPNVKIEETSIPDPGYRYAIKYNPSSFSDDRLCISRTPSGLLYDVQFASDDRVPEIAFNIARFVAGAAPKKATFFQTSGTGADIRIRVHTGRVDPFDRHSMETFNEGLHGAFGKGLRLDFSRAEQIVEPSRRALPASCTRRGGGGCTPADLKVVCKPDHICYRTRMSLPIELTQNGRPIDINYVDMVNIYDIGAVSVTRAMLVHKISKFRFYDGALVAAIIRKPSEIEELSLMPIHIVNAALITPSGMWAAAFNSNNTDKTTLVNSMIDLTGKVSNLETNLKHLSQGTGPDFETNGDLKYTLDCAGPARGSPTNIITGVVGGTQF